MRTPPALRFSLTLSLPFAHQRPHSLRISPSSSTSSSWRRWLDPLPFLFPHLRWESPGLPESPLVPRTPLSSPPPPLSKLPTDFTSPLEGLQFMDGCGRASPPSGWGGGVAVSSVGFPSHRRRGRQLSGSRLSNPNQKALCCCGCLKATFGQKG